MGDSFEKKYKLSQEVLGEGSSATVYKGCELETNKEVAVK